MKKEENAKKLGKGLVIASIILAIIVIILVSYVIYLKCYTNNKPIDIETPKQIEKNVVENTVNNTTTKQENAENSSENIILYKGCKLEPKTGIQNVILMKENEKSKYELTYYNYSNENYTGETKGSFNKILEGGYIVENVGEIAMTKKYDAIPRKTSKLEQMPQEFAKANPDFADNTSVKGFKIDLDGDSKDEYIVITAYERSKENTEDGIPVASSNIYLFDSNYKVIANLIGLNEGYLKDVSGNVIGSNKTLLNEENINCIDLDNDATMEIIIDIPMYESQGNSKVSIVKYNKGNFEGEKNIKASIQP